jgi:phage shock protein PspC (stress-responsive transcriptional regulator)
MTDQNLSAPQHRPLRRSREDRVLGGVCAGIAQQLDVDPLVIRIAAVAVGLVSGGAAVLAYLIAWALVPHAVGEPRRVTPPPVRSGSARDAWSAAGGELRSLATGLRQTPPAPGPDAAADADAEQRDRSRAAAIDAAMTSLGDRLRDPEVRAGARRSAAGLSAAVGASIEEIAARTRRGDIMTAPTSITTPIPAAPSTAEPSS